MFRRILVPLDGSPRARQAIPLAARIARASGGSVMLLSVWEPAIQVAWRTQLVPVQFENRMAERKGMAAELAQQVTSEALHGEKPRWKEPKVFQPSSFWSGLKNNRLT